MRDMPGWRFNEFQPPGRDYGAESEVAIYEETHRDFRDLVAEAEEALNLIGVQGGETLIDFGAGTGVFGVEAAKRGASVQAVDVSEAMLAEGAKKAAAAGLARITFHHGGFLSHECPDASVDIVTTTFAFHHLPDFWKGVALKRLHRMLKPGGKLYMRDVILEEGNALENINAFIEQQAEAGGDFLRDDAIGHFRDEFSTYDWVMEGLFERAGFQVVYRAFEGAVIGVYLCIAAPRVAGAGKF